MALGLYLIPGFPSWKASQEALDLAQAMGVDFVEFPVLGTGRWSVRTGRSIATALDRNRDILRRMNGRMHRWLDSVSVGVGVIYEGAWVESARWAAHVHFLECADALLLEPSVDDWQERAARAAAWGKALIATVDGHRPECDPEESRALAVADGFVYMSLGSKTGERSSGVEQMGGKVKAIRANGCALPICAAFGIRGPADVEEVRAAGCDGVIIGSAAVDVLAQGARRFEQWLDRVIDACAA